MIDIYGANESRLNDFSTVNGVFAELCKVLNLTSVMPPFILPYYYARDALDDGISAFVFLLGGHITIHTFPERRCLFLDIMYDGYYDEMKLKSILKNYFFYDIINCVHTDRRFYDTLIDKTLIYDKNNENKDFGPHTIARIEDVNVSFEQLFEMLDDMPSKISMTPISRPYVIKSTPHNTDYLSGIVLIAQSHIAFHYSIKERRLYCDCFSCSFYEVENFANYLKQYFSNVESMTIIRGSAHVDARATRADKINDLSAWMKPLRRKK